MSLGLDETSTTRERTLGGPTAVPDAPSPAVAASSAEPSQASPFAELGLTYDDVLLQPGETDVITSEVDTTARLTRGISIRVPLISAAMDTVTEARMAIAMARHGGIGILHRNLSIEDQAYQVDLVKRTQTGMISNPVTIGPDATLEELDEICGRYRVSGLPVVDDDMTLLGIITNRDLRFVPVAEWATTHVAVDDRETRDPVLPADLVELLQRRLRADRHRVGDDPGLGPLHEVDLIGLVLDRQVAMQHPETALPGHRDRHPGLGDGVHRAGDQRHPQADLPGQPRGGVDLAGDDVGLPGQQQHVVVGQSEREELVRHACGGEGHAAPSGVGAPGRQSTGGAHAGRTPELGGRTQR